MSRTRNILAVVRVIADLTATLTLFFAIYQFFKNVEENRESQEKAANLEIEKIKLTDSLTKAHFLAEKEVEAFSRLEDCIGGICAPEVKDKRFNDAVLEFNNMYYGKINLFLPEAFLNDLKILHSTLKLYIDDKVERRQLVRTAEDFQKKLRLLMTHRKLIRDEI